MAHADANTYLVDDKVAEVVAVYLRVSPAILLADGQVFRLEPRHDLGELLGFQATSVCFDTIATIRFSFAVRGIQETGLAMSGARAAVATRAG